MTLCKQSLINFRRLFAISAWTLSIVFRKSPNCLYIGVLLHISFIHFIRALRHIEACSRCRIPYYTAFPWRLAAFSEVHCFLVGAWLGCYKHEYDVMGRMSFRFAGGTLQSSCRYLLACYLMLAWPGEVAWRWSEVYHRRHSLELAG